jgi:hypothetical protein
MTEMRELHVYDCALRGGVMMRIMLAAVLATCGLVVAPHARANPDNCPPACDRIPDSAWIAPWDIPLNSTYGWPGLAGVAVTAVAPRFRFEELCAAPPVPQDPRGYAVAERASVGNPGSQWQLQVQVVHWRGETWRGGELAQEVFGDAVSALRACQLTAPATSPSITTDEPTRLAAVISGPVIVHQYLVADLDNSTVTELAMWATAPPAVPWPVIPDAEVLDAMAAPLCTAYIGSCR